MISFFFFYEHWVAPLYPPIPTLAGVKILISYQKSSILTNYCSSLHRSRAELVDIIKQDRWTCATVTLTPYASLQVWTFEITLKYVFEIPSYFWGFLPPFSIKTGLCSLLRGASQWRENPIINAY
jgi:hypothetical protein